MSSDQVENENKQFEQRVSAIDSWFKSPRFDNVHRPYTARQVAALRMTFQYEYPSNFLSKKMFKMLTEAKKNKSFHMTFGALDPVQAYNMAKHLKTIYISGWQCSSTASTTNEPGPDLADYPANTVPNKVDQIVKGLLLQDRIQNSARSKMSDQEKRQNPPIDFLVPIIADGDTGFGGLTSTMKLTKLMIEAGAAGIHLEDQRGGTKKCGHMSGKVIVSCREHANRLISARLQADIMGCELIVVARTDALSAKFIDSSADPIDQPYIIGESPDGKRRTFPEAGMQAIQKFYEDKSSREKMEQLWKQLAYKLTFTEAKEFARKNGFPFQLNWEKIRSPEGYYAVKGCVELCAARTKEFLKFADMAWMETDSPNLEVASKYAVECQKTHPTKLYCYNLSPSFNWSGFGMSNDQIKNFCQELANLGFVWQFITLAGFHLNALKSMKLVRALDQDKMLGYVETVQKKEHKNKIDQITHQKWSGANYVDQLMQACVPDVTTLSSSGDSTEKQFGSH